MSLKRPAAGGDSCKQDSFAWKRERKFVILVLEKKCEMGDRNSLKIRVMFRINSLMYLKRKILSIVRYFMQKQCWNPMQSIWNRKRL